MRHPLAALTRRPGDNTPVAPWHRRVSIILVVFVAASAVLFWPPQPAMADTTQCTLQQWKDIHQVEKCIDRLPAVNQVQNDCMNIPTPSPPDSGFGGWFASEPKFKPGSGAGPFSSYGYANYVYPSYHPDCASGANPLPSSEQGTTMVANTELMVATGIIGAANAFRERAYQPDTMWGWSDKLVNNATKAIYQKVFSVFGVVTLAIVGLYLIWRSRQSDMSDALTTAGWAVLVMVVVTAAAAWPLTSAHLADGTLVSTLGLVHDAVGPQPKNTPLDQCSNATGPSAPGVTKDPSLCYDHRPPALRASDTATQSVLLNNWIRGSLGSTTSPAADKYGLALYVSSALTWQQAQDIQKSQTTRASTYKHKSEEFLKVANQIKNMDPDAYNYLQGKDGSGRVGAGLIAIISALGFAFFDIAASLLILLGFLIFRWAVVALPVIGTIAILRPASGGFKRLVNIVIAAIFNIVIFGVGASAYLFAVDLIMDTNLAGWLQITLVWLCGIVGWLLLRPFRRITQLGGKSSMGDIAHIGSWHRKFFGDLKDVAIGAAAGAAVGDVAAQEDSEKKGKKKGRSETTGDPSRPATAEAGSGPLSTGGEPDKQTGPPEGQPKGAGGGETKPAPAETRPRAERQPAAVAHSSGYSGESYAATGHDDQVWVADTGRLANGEDADSDLARSVGRANDGISAYSDGAERESQDYYQRARARG